MGESPLRAMVTRVYDGDTVRITHADDTDTDVRLLGLNAPEDGECFHDEALQNAIALLENAEVELTQPSLDQFGRTLAHVWVGSRHINLEIVRTGHAIATTPAEGDPHGSRLLEAERSAAQSGRGLWGRGVCGATGPVPEVTIHVVDHDPPGPDEEQLDGEILEIVNAGSRAVDVSGWTLRDESSRHRYRFAGGSTLSGGGRMRISSADPRWDPGQSPVWNNDGDMAMLVDDVGRVVDVERY